MDIREKKREACIDSVQIICLHILISFCFTSEEILFWDEKLGHIHPLDILCSKTQRKLAQRYIPKWRERERESVSSRLNEQLHVHISIIFCWAPLLPVSYVIRIQKYLSSDQMSRLPDRFSPNIFSSSTNLAFSVRPRRLRSLRIPRQKFLGLHLRVSVS